MTVPTYPELIDPLLRVLAEHGGPMRAADAKVGVADRVGLTEEQRAEMLPSGAHARYAHRVGWAQDSTKRQELTFSPTWGMWELTPKGHELLKAHAVTLPDAEIRRIATSNRRTPIAELVDGEEPVTLSAAEPPTDSPEERLEHALAEIRESVATDLLERILQAAPDFFETLVLDLLHALGYGIISLDRLGLEKVYVQAKRWQNNVGRPELQAFYGALAGQRAKKGVFMTTSGYTKDALDFAHTVSDSMVLVDGDRLTALMIEHAVGVTHRPMKLPRIDADYFDAG